MKQPMGKFMVSRRICERIDEMVGGGNTAYYERLDHGSMIEVNRTPSVHSELLTAVYVNEEFLVESNIEAIATAISQYILDSRIPGAKP